MRISNNFIKIQNDLNLAINKPKSQNKQPSTPFGAHYDDVRKVLLSGDGFAYKWGSIKNYTTLFRNFTVFKELPNFLEKEYPNGAKIYDYACSRGHEASSIVIGILDSLSPQKAKQYLPIYAFDNNQKILQMNDNHSLKLDEDEIRIFKWFENSDINDYFKHLRHSSTSDQELYKMRDKLSDNISFDYGDVFEDLENQKFSNEPCILFFRNAWQFLTEDGITTLSESLFNNLHSKSSVIIGNMDIHRAKADNALLNVGFNRINKIDSLNFKNPVLQRNYGYFNADETLPNFCFMKP